MWHMKRIPEEAQDLIRQLLIKDRRQRLEMNTFDKLKRHAFFEGIDFARVFEEDPPTRILSFKIESQSTICTTPVRKRKSKCKGSG